MLTLISLLRMSMQKAMMLIIGQIWMTQRMKMLKNLLKEVRALRQSLHVFFVINPITKKLKVVVKRSAQASNGSKWDSIVTEAVNSNNFERVQKITEYLDNQTKIPYHRSCLFDYRNLIAKRVHKPAGVWHKTRDCYKAAYAVVQNFIVKFVIKKKNACTLDFITQLFKESLIDEYNKIKSSGLRSEITTRSIWSFTGNSVGLRRKN